ncbi:hypothetical protein ACLMJK_007757 [Lecanora helva]
MQKLVASWASPNFKAQETPYLPNDFDQIRPIPVHSHNDYWRRIPLYEALAAGCTGVEADVWLTNNDLLVGHTKNSLSPARSLKTMYIDPLLTILTHQNPRSPLLNSSYPSLNSTNSPPKTGIFTSSPTTPLTLLIDIKSNGTTTLPLVLQHLQPLRSQGFLTHFDGKTVIPGPITVVGTGNTPFSLLTQNTTYRDIFFDAPLEQFSTPISPTNTSIYDSTNSYYASTSFAKTVGRVGKGGVLSEAQLGVIRGQIRGARERGLRSRYWDTPGRKGGRRDYVWDLLVREGVGVLNVDDVEAAGRREW